MPDYLDAIDQEAGIAPAPPAPEPADEVTLGEWVAPADLERDVDDPSLPLYFTNHPAGYQWRIIPRGEQWLIQDRGITTWSDRETHPTIDAAQDAVEADAKIALAEADVEADDAVAATVEPDQAAPAPEEPDAVRVTPTPAEVSAALMSEIDALLAGSVLNAHQQAVVLAAATALREGVIPTRFLDA